MEQEILVQETAGVARLGELVRVSLPCEPGSLPFDRLVGVLPPAGDVLACQQRVLKRWPDGSTKWLLIDFPAAVPAGGAAIYRIAPVSASLPVVAGLEVVAGPASWEVRTGAGTFTVDARNFRPLLSVSREGEELLGAGASRCRLIIDGRELDPVLEVVELEDPGPLRAVLRLCGHFDGTGMLHQLRFTCRLHFFAGSLALRMEFTLHNAAAARHSGGLWDLGDPGSVLISELSWGVSLPEARRESISLFPADQAHVFRMPGGQGVTLYQESSGGANWQSANHRNRDGVVPLQHRGYLIESEGRKLGSGLRAEPTLWCGGAVGVGLAAALPTCWQEFPKELRVGAGWLEVGFLPGRFPDLHELQGGERKTHCVELDFLAPADPLFGALAPLRATLAPRHYRDCGIFFDLPFPGDLVSRFTGPQDLLGKREMLDEYGWRNFGEVYADHEAVGHQEGGCFVSHYNNQYDLCGGAYRQFFATGDLRWRELAGDLARHVLDIDIYHTDEDRDEYNHGLFWHTSHYIDAGLSTHRTMSREHLKEKDPRFYGGGPGYEHCYTTGLAYHYFLTGNPEYRNAVVGLALWCFRALTGSRTVLATLHQTVRNLKLLRHYGVESRPLFPRFPLTRGTGNGLTACLDAFEVTGEPRFLALAEELILGALHPDDDLAARDLLNAEICWSYTVLLAALGKYLHKKEELGQLDEAYQYGRASLLAYARWMLDHEYPYLDKPEKLEFPNETWAGQDLRKAVVLYHAARLDGALAPRFLLRARELYDTATLQLAAFPTSTLTRPVALMLQNGWIGGALEAGAPPLAPVPPQLRALPGQPAQVLSILPVLARCVGELCYALGHLDLRREAAWLRARVGA
ncbi:hypothetical protein GMLC_01360 [Geomonas limicola]|uniref:Uncharacterized protein n=1 Tax=Geomonas limicola TaxID=2740186 RepID=A0A6V8N3W6_9BACT|nr:hypothetical protein [Geomonas limicola]GFO66557.1 hypothetical protein GMLC_01360 [Geomonas limicola]